MLESKAINKFCRINILLALRPRGPRVQNNVNVVLNYSGNFIIRCASRATPPIDIRRQFSLHKVCLCSCTPKHRRLSVPLQQIVHVWSMPGRRLSLCFYSISRYIIARLSYNPHGRCKGIYIHLNLGRL